MSIQQHIPNIPENTTPVNFVVTVDDIVTIPGFTVDYARRVLFIIKSTVAACIDKDEPLLFDLDGLGGDKALLLGLKYTRDRIIFTVAIPNNRFNNIDVLLPSIKVTDDLIIPLKRL